MSKIKTYEDLLQEEQRLMAHLKGQEVQVRQDLAGFKEGLQPIGNAMKWVNKLTTRDRTNAFATFGIDFSVDLLVRRFLLARAGWLTKIVIPYLLKNYGSHFISEKQRAAFLKKINNLFSKLRPKPDAAEAAYQRGEDPDEATQKS
jgi:hypothetical protein